MYAPLAQAYDACAALLLRRLAEAESRSAAAEGLPPGAGAGGAPEAEGVGAVGGGGVAVLLATHNRASVAAATRRMSALGLPAAHCGVHFAQILGMADDLTLALGLQERQTDR